MEYEYTNGLPLKEIKGYVKDESVDEIWIFSAYYSANIIREIFNLIKKRKKKPTFHFVVSSSSVNPLQDISDGIFELKDVMKSDFNFHLVETPLMHSKIFLAKKKDSSFLYMGSGNFTNRADQSNENSNIESGILISSSSAKECKYLEDFLGKCRTDDSDERLLRKSIFSHFRSEILFLALEESKLSQAVYVSPDKLKKLVIPQPGNKDETEKVSVKDQSAMRICTISIEDRDLLINLEKRLKKLIQENLAIKIDGYGWVSSYWSLEKSDQQKEHCTNIAFQDFREAFKIVYEKFSDIRYRTEEANKIRSGIRKWVGEHDIDNSDSDVVIEKYLKKFELSVDKKGSPYHAISRLYNQISESESIFSLLNPYKVGDDELDDRGSEIDIVSADQVNLSVMCKLAMKLRTKRSPNIPAVWWFDIGLDKNFCETHGGSSITEYRVTSHIQLEKIVEELKYPIPVKDLDDHLDTFCRITGFNLGAKYPVIYEVDAWIEEDQKIEEEQPYIFIRPTIVRYNPVLDILNNQVAMISLDKVKIPKDWEYGDDKLHKTGGEFVLGKNLKLYVDDSPSAYLYIDAKKFEIEPK